MLPPSPLGAPILVRTEKDLVVSGGGALASRLRLVPQEVGDGTGAAGVFLLTGCADGVNVLTTFLMLDNASSSAVELCLKCKDGEEEARLSAGQVVAVAVPVATDCPADNPFCRPAVVSEPAAAGDAGRV